MTQVPGKLASSCPARTSGSRPAPPSRPLTVPGLGLGLGARRLLLPAARRAPHPPARRPPAQRAGHAAGGTASPGPVPVPVPAGRETERGGGGGGRERRGPPGPASARARVNQRGRQRPARPAPPRAPRPALRAALGTAAPPARPRPCAAGPARTVGTDGIGGGRDGLLGSEEFRAWEMTALGTSLLLPAGKSSYSTFPEKHVYVTSCHQNHWLCTLLTPYR